MNRTYEIRPDGDGWALDLFEDGEPAGGGVGGPEDYCFLLDQAEQFVGSDL